MKRAASFAFPLVLALGAALQAQDQPAQDTDKVQNLVKKLGHEDFKVREEAQKELEKMGPEILPRLKKALKETDDPEIRTRLEQIIEKQEKPEAGEIPPEEHLPEEWPFGGNAFRFKIQQIPGWGRMADPKKQLEKMSRIVERMEKVLKDDKRSDDDKVEELVRLAGRMQLEGFGIPHFDRMPPIPPLRKREHSRRQPERRIPAEKSGKAGKRDMEDLDEFSRLRRELERQMWNDRLEMQRLLKEAMRDIERMMREGWPDEEREKDD